jgi:hypothetical protein
LLTRLLTRLEIRFVTRAAASFDELALLPPAGAFGVTFLSAILLTSLAGSGPWARFELLVEV